MQIFSCEGQGLGQGSGAVAGAGAGAGTEAGARAGIILSDCSVEERSFDELCELAYSPIFDR
jgi:hypothetical protein